MMRFIFTFILISVTIIVNAQSSNGRSKSELGLIGGGSYYIGDLNQYRHFYNTHFSGSVFYRYNIHTRLSFRTNFTYAKVGASDEDAKSAINQNRNLNFSSSIYELASGVELTYLPFYLGRNETYQGTFYLLAQIGVFRMNPKTEYNGEEIALQALGTEGQGSSLSSKKNYSLTQLSIPLGLGFKMALGKQVSLGIEYTIRKTFTDYLDDVKSNAYIDPAQLSIENGPTAAALSNRSIDGNRYGKRGNSSTKDWFSTFGLTLSVRLGKPNKCPMKF